MPMTKNGDLLGETGTNPSRTLTGLLTPGKQTMAFYIQTNMVAQRSERHLANVERSLGSTIDRVSSGKRVNGASDDAAGLAVSESLDASVKGSRQAMRNIEQGVSLIRVAESGTETTQRLVKRMRELAVMGSSESLASTERAYLQDEFHELVAEVDDLANNTLFGGVHLVDGQNPTLAIQVGVNNSSNDRITIQMGDISVDTIGLNTGLVSLATSSQAQDAIDQIDSTLNTLNGYRAQYGASERSLSQALGNMEFYAENLASAQSRIVDADFAAETANFSRHQIVKQAGLAVLAQGNSIGQGLLGLL